MKLSFEEKLARKLFTVGYNEVKKYTPGLFKLKWETAQPAHRAGWRAVAKYVIANFKGLA